MCRLLNAIDPKLNVPLSLTHTPTHPHTHTLMLSFAHSQIRYSKLATKRSFPARDNVAKFLEAIKVMGVKDVNFFSPNDLMCKLCG